MKQYCLCYMGEYIEAIVGVAVTDEMIPIIDFGKLTEKERLALLRRGASLTLDSLLAEVSPIVEKVRTGGDDALFEFSRRFDGVELESFEVGEDEWDVAIDLLPDGLFDSISHAVDNVQRFHEQQLPRGLWTMEIEPGVVVGEKTTPISRAGLYVPGGKGLFPSVMIMLAVPAQVAGVGEVVACTPPRPDGTVDPASLVAADLCSVSRVFKLGGAHAVAAMAYGTETVPKVDKMLGPAGPHAYAAMQMVSDDVALGLPAGPSEAIILADDSADPEIVAADLLVEAEHGPDSTSILVTDSRELSQKVQKLVVGGLGELPEPRGGFARSALRGIVLVRDMDEAVDFVNNFAPEHLMVHTIEPFETLGGLRNAGEILLGRWSPITAGNFAAGTNAVLPTGGWAKVFSGVSVRDYVKTSTIGYLTEEGLSGLRDTLEMFAEYEGFPAHSRAVKKRFTDE